MGRFLSDLCNHNHLNRYSNIEKIVHLLKLDEFSLTICHDCEDASYEESMQNCYEDYLVCDSCCNENNYTYSEYRDTYISYEDADEENREPRL